MAAPYVRAVGPLATQPGGTSIKISMPAFSPGDLIVIIQQGIAWFSDSSGAPAPSNGFREVEGGVKGVGGFELLWWRRASATTPTTMTVEHTSSLTWWAYAVSFGNVDFTDPGWLTLPGGVGNYGRWDRSDVTANTEWNFAARVEFDALGVTNRIAGWGAGDASFVLNASNRLNLTFINTLGATLGGAQAGADIPGLAVGKKVWVRVSINTTTATSTYWYSYSDTEDLLSVRWVQLGSPVVGSGAGTTIRVTNSETVYLGTDNSTNAAMAGKIYSFVEWVPGLFLLYIVLSDDQPAAFVKVGTVTQRQPTSQNSQPFDDWWIQLAGIVFIDNNVYIPNRLVYDQDRLIFNGFHGANFAGINPNPAITGPGDWDAHPDSTWVFGQLVFKNVLRSKQVDASPGDAPVSASPDMNWGYWTIAIRGAATPPSFPASPQPAVRRIGCAETYSVWLTDQTYSTTLEQFRWSSIDWERVLDDISTSRVTIPDTYGGVLCEAAAQGVRPWQYGLHIERNDQEVWSGPIRTVQRVGTSIVVNAADKFARYQKRLLIRENPLTYTEQDAGLLFADIINIHARQAADQWMLECPELTVHVPITRTMRPRQGKMAWDLLSELLDTAVDGYIMNGRLYVWEPGSGWVYQNVIKRTLDGPYNTDYEFIYGTFTEEAFGERPDWTMDGAGQGNFIFTPTADTGEMGFRQYAVAEDLNSQATYGILDVVDPSPLETPEDETPAQTDAALRARAATLLTLRSQAPVVMEGGRLSEIAPVDMDNLRPGSLWVTDIYDHGFGQLLSVCRLRRVSVSVTIRDGQINESIQPVLYPPGWSGDLGDLG